MGLFPGQIDLGWWLIKTFEAFGLATNVKTPSDLPERPELRRLAKADDAVDDGGWPILRYVPGGRR